jgi:hypothetical protein
MKKLIIMTVAIATLCLLVAGCAAMPASAMFGPGNFYSDTARTGVLRGEATSRVYLNFFGTESYPSVERVAKENGIGKIATVEHYSRLGILGIWTDYITIVTGE